ncbi:MAG: hypothetical protein ABIK28_23825, partial [Planctomycetota bacterium]
MPQKTAIRMALIYTAFTTIFMVVTFSVTLHRVNRYFFSDVAHELLHEAIDLGMLLRNPETPPDYMHTFLKSISSLWQENALGISIRNGEGELIYETAMPISPELLEGLTYTPVDELRPAHVLTVFIEGQRHSNRIIAFSVPAPDHQEFQCVFSLYPRFIVRSVTNIKYNLLWILLSSLAVFPVLGFILV